MTLLEHADLKEGRRSAIPISPVSTGQRLESLLYPGLLRERIFELEVYTGRNTIRSSGPSSRAAALVTILAVDPCGYASLKASWGLTAGTIWTVRGSKP